MTKKYINNLETGHIELHFDKKEYNQLTVEQKKLLKSGYLFSRYITAWVSRSTKNHYRALEIAEELGFTEEEKQGERLSFEEELKVKTEKAERRTNKYEYKAEKATKKAENLQSEFNERREDIAFITQPNINSSSGKSFTNYRDKIMDRYNKGFEEYRKSEYFKDKAQNAKDTANIEQFKDPVYLNNRIKECNSIIRKLEKNIINYKEKINRIEQGEELKNYKDEILTTEQYQNWIDEMLEKMEYQIDKLAYMENCMEEIGGNKFSKENIKVGYIVNLRRWGKCKVTSTGSKNIQYTILTGGAKGCGGSEPYAAITEIIEAKEEKKEVKNPFKIGDIVTRSNASGNIILHAYQVVKTTDKTITVQEIEIKDNKPIKNNFISDKQKRKTVKQDRQNNFVVNDDGDWYLYKYIA